MKDLKLLGALLLLGLLVTFSIQNAELLRVNFLFWSFEMRRALLLFVVLAVGLLLGWALHSFRSASTKEPDNDGS